MAENMVVVEQVRPNAMAIQRVNAERMATGLAAVAVTPAPDDADIIGRTQAQLATTASARPAASAASAATALPRSVDNTATPWFPPIRHQGGLGSCVSFSSVYYTMTYMVARARGIDVAAEGSRAWRTPRFINNLISAGTNNGSIIPLAYSAMLNHGAPSWETWPYTTDFLSWPTSAAIWREAVPYRMASSGSVLTSTDSGQVAMKQMLANGYILNYATDIFGWQWARLGDDPATTADDAFVGQHVVPWCQDNDSGHAMTVVGYNDDLWYDINGNGQVDVGEKGAFKIANSWGWWQNSGCAWVCYDALRSVSEVPAWTAANRVTCFWSGTAYYITARPEHHATLLAEFTVNTAKRSQVAMRQAVSPTTSATPTRWLNTSLMNSGGAYAFDGTTTAVDATFVLDLTDAVVNGAGRYYVQVQDNAVGNAAIVRDFRLTDGTGTTVASLSGTSPAGGLPQSPDASTLLVWADLVASDTRAPSAVTDLAVASAQPTSGAVAFTSPGDDGATGQAKSYDLRYARTVISDATWASATQAAGEPSPGISGVRQGVTLSGLASGTWYVAMKSVDDAGNTSALSNVVTLVIPETLQLTGVTALPSGMVGVSYATVLTAAGGIGARTWTPLEGVMESNPGISGSAVAGTAQGWQADNGSWTCVFPNGFTFPFAGVQRTQVRVSSDGYLEFGSSIDASTLIGDSAMKSAAMIAVGWADLTTAGSGVAGEDIYVATDADSVTVRWLGERMQVSSAVVDFQVTLRRDGSVDMVWNRSTSGITPVKGVSYGDGIHWGRSALSLVAPVAGQYRIWRQLGWPAGISLDPSTGALSGVPTGAGDIWMGIAVSDEGVPVQQATGLRSLRIATPGSGNQPPVAHSQSVAVTEDVAASVTLSASDPEGATLTYAIATAPSKGVLSGTGATRTYTPNANATGSDSFTFTVSDGALTSAAATVSLTITAVNDAPVAASESVTVTEDVAQAITLVGSDAEGTALTYAIATAPSRGALSGTGAARTYTPNANATGTDSFTFTVSDGVLTSAAATVSLTITAVNDVPVAEAQSVSTGADQACAIQLHGTDADGDALVYALAALPPPTEGTVSLTGSVATFTPAQGWSGRTGFSFTAYDGTNISVPAVVGVRVAAAPAALLTVDVRLDGMVGHDVRSLRIDGVAVPLDADGYWSVEIPVPVGTSTVELRAVDEAGNETVRLLQAIRGTGG